MTCLLLAPAGLSGAHCQETPGSWHPATAVQEPGGTVGSGQVLIGDLPADSGTVVLHRVSAQSAAEIDSVRFAEGGAFEIRLPGDAGDGMDDVFFAAVRHQGVLYFGEAFTGRPEDGRHAM